MMAHTELPTYTTFYFSNSMDHALFLLLCNVFNTRFGVIELSPAATSAASATAASAAST